MTSIIARWIGDGSDAEGRPEGFYGVECRIRGHAIHWTSSDGDNWLDADTGEPPTGKIWEKAEIKLCGGPRDGTIVG